jgi:FSR family fosmidomycin resistance protein-like MFS transporter
MVKNTWARKFWTPLASLQIWRGLSRLAFVFLTIEFYDELVYGLQSAALPALRADLALTYAQVGLLLGLPQLIGTLVEPFLMLLGDTRLRKHLVVGGGLAIGLALLIIAGVQSFALLLLAFVISYPASGAFVSLSQATLMDLNHGRQAQMMARWTVFGSLGSLLGPALLAGLYFAGVGWRPAFLGLAVLALGLTTTAWRMKFPAAHPASGEHAPSLAETPHWLIASLGSALQQRRLLRWVGLIELSDLMLDVFTSYAALYLSDVAGLNAAQTGLALTLLMLASLAADLLLIPLLERYSGRLVVRASAFLAIPIFCGFLLAPWPLVKILLMIGVRLSTIGWYQVLKGEAYASLPERSGSVSAISSLGGLVGGALTWFIGWVAYQAGLPAAMWLMLAAPISLLLFTPKPAAIQLPPLAHSPRDDF